VEGLRDRHVRPAQAGAVRVAVTAPKGNVVEATPQKLLIAAREQATKGVLDPKGLLAADIAAHKLLVAHLKSMRPGVLAPVGDLESAKLGMPQAAMAAAPMAPGGGLEIVPVIKSNERRPTYPLTASFLFEHEFLTENYVEALSGPAPQPAAPAPGVRHLP
jgi:hypothetical protein